MILYILIYCMHFLYGVVPIKFIFKKLQVLRNKAVRIIRNCYRYSSASSLSLYYKSGIFKSTYCVLKSNGSHLKNVTLE